MKISKDIVFTENTLNIFTDASIKQRNCGETIGCAGALAYIGDNFVDKQLEIIRNTTNGDSEIKAIEIGVKLALMYRNRVTNINLFSDSKISISGLREWIFKWVQVSSGTELIKSDGQPVLHQEVYLRIINMILDNNLRINFYHQKGHVNIGNNKSLENTKDLFIKHNYLQHDVNLDLIKEISHMNILIDTETRYMVNNCNIQEQPQQAMTVCYKPFDVYRYATLINAPLVELSMEG